MSAGDLADPVILVVLLVWGAALVGVSLAAVIVVVADFRLSAARLALLAPSRRELQADAGGVPADQVESFFQAVLR